MEEIRPMPDSAALRQRAWSEYIERAGRGDESALGSLYDESKSLVYGIALRILGQPADAEEVTLDVYTQVWRSAADFDESRGAPTSWLALMTRSRAIDRVRSRTARARLEEPMAAFPEPPSPSGPPDPGGQAVRQAMRALTPEHRQLLDLAFFSGFTHSELAKKLNLPLGTVKTRLRAAMHKLKEELTRAAGKSVRSSHGA
jgi:RNA polymerase sigma-70 factor (ECF subfamily)